nr:hypothetical protein [Candidatus Sigynarchaeota archaeon]
MAADFYYYAILITTLATMPTIIFMLFQLGKKYRDSLNPETGKRDPVRLLVLLQIVFWFSSILYPTVYRLVFLENPASMFNTLNPSSISIAFVVATGVTLLAFVHHKESWMYAAWFFYAGVILYMVFTMDSTTFYMLQFGFTLVGQVSFDLFYFITGIKYKDDKILGLAIFFFVPIISGASSSNPFIYIICYGFLAIYGIPYTMGKIKFFKQKPVQLVEAEARG